MRVCSLLHTPRADVGTINSALLRYALFTNDEIAHRVHFDVNRHVETLSQSQIKRYIFSPLLKNQNSKADSPAKTPAEKSLISYPVTKVAKVLHFSLAVSGASHHTTDIHAATTAATITTTSKCCSRIQVTRKDRPVLAPSRGRSAPLRYRSRRRKKPWSGNQTLRWESARNTDTRDLTFLVLVLCAAAVSSCIEFASNFSGLVGGFFVCVSNLLVFGVQTARHSTINSTLLIVVVPPGAIKRPITAAGGAQVRALSLQMRPVARLMISCCVSLSLA